MIKVIQEKWHQFGIIEPKVEHDLNLFWLEIYPVCNQVYYSGIIDKKLNKKELKLGKNGKKN